MKKYVLVSMITPAKENIRATSALPYHLLVERDKDIALKIYTFNFNDLNDAQIKETEEKLNAEIILMKKPAWIVWVLRFNLLLLRLLLKFPIHNYLRISEQFVQRIMDEDAESIIIYGEEMSQVVKQFKERKRYHILPDCESLYYLRMMGKRFVFTSSQYWRCAFMYKKYLNMERDFATDSDITYCLVGEEDRNHLREVNPGVNAIFFKHPHYEVDRRKDIKFAEPKIKLLIAGQNNYYMQQDADAIIKHLSECCRFNEIAKNYIFTFLGKGWEDHVKMLQEKGAEVNHITFAPDYIEEVCKHDIQLTPISIGTGTKGKVLDALSNGLLVIGSYYALENISVVNNDSCIEYNNIEDVEQILIDIPKSREKYERIAERGRENVLSHHGRKLVCNTLFSL